MLKIDETCSKGQKRCLALKSRRIPGWRGAAKWVANFNPLSSFMCQEVAGLSGWAMWERWLSTRPVDVFLHYIYILHIIYIYCNIIIYLHAIYIFIYFTSISFCAWGVPIRLSKRVHLVDEARELGPRIVGPASSKSLVWQGLGKSSAPTRAPAPQGQLPRAFIATWCHLHICVGMICWADIGINSSHG